MRSQASTWLPTPDPRPGAGDKMCSLRSNFLPGARSWCFK